MTPSARRIPYTAMLARGGALLVGAAAVAYWFIVRPWHPRWGATAAEVSRPWPGDELMAQPRTRAVRAVTVAAPPGRVWPWIMQVGRDRGGFYSYTWLENLIGADIRNVYRLIPGLGERRRRDTVWLGPEDRFGGQARLVVAKVVHERAMVLVPPGDAERAEKEGRAREGVWSFVLDPMAQDRTRLVRQGHATKTRTLKLLKTEPAPVLNHDHREERATRARASSLGASSSPGSRADSLIAGLDAVPHRPT